MKYAILATVLVVISAIVGYLCGYHSGSNATSWSNSRIEKMTRDLSNGDGFASMNKDLFLDKLRSGIFEPQVVFATYLSPSYDEKCRADEIRLMACLSAFGIGWTWSSSIVSGNAIDVKISDYDPAVIIYERLLHDKLLKNLKITIHKL